MRRTRRGTLASLATTAALAGCLSGTNLGDSPTGTGTDAGHSLALGAAYDAGDRTVTVDEVAVRKLIATPDVGSTAHVDVAGFPGDQFLLGRITAEGGEPPAKRSLSVVADGDRLDATDYRLDGFEDAPTQFALRVPVTDASTAAVVWERDDEPAVRWTFPGDLVTALGTEPSFDVRRFETPDSVAPGDPIPVTLEVANDGERDGRFVAELGAIVLSDVGEVRFDVPTSDPVTRECTLTPSRYTPMYGDTGDPLPVVLDWGLDRLERTVGIEG